MIACFHAVGMYEVDRHLLKNNRSFSNVLELKCLSISLDIDQGIFEGLSLRLLHRFFMFSVICLLMKFLSSNKHICFNECSKFFVILIMMLRFVEQRGVKLGNAKSCDDVIDWMEEYVLYHF